MSPTEMVDSDLGESRLSIRMGVGGGEINMVQGQCRCTKQAQRYNSSVPETLGFWRKVVQVEICTFCH